MLLDAANPAEAQALNADCVAAGRPDAVRARGRC